MKPSIKNFLPIAAIVLLIAMAVPSYPAQAGATLCVNPGGTDGCYSSIQAAVDAAASGDIIQVAAGTYIEQVTIHESMQLIGAGAGVSTIQAPVVRSESVAQGGQTYDYLLAAYPATGTINVHVEGFTFDANGQSRTAGTAGLIGVFMRDVNGASAGLFSSTIEGFEAVEYQSWGVKVYGASELTIGDNTLKDYTRDGIDVIGDGGAGTDPVVVISNNFLTGSSLALNGIQVSSGAVGSISGNQVLGHSRSTPWAAVGILVQDSVGGNLISGNHVGDCFYGILLRGADGVSVINNTLTDNIAFHIGLDDSDSNTVSANFIVGTADGSEDKAIGFSNGSTNNMIGGVNAVDGNTIMFAPSGSGLLYDIYVQGGSGSNTIQNNTISGGKRAVQVDGGNNGTTTILDNMISGTSFAGVYFNAGHGVVRGNTLTSTVRPVEFWGALSMIIESNTFMGTTFDVINAGAVAGEVQIHNNAFPDVPQWALIMRTPMTVDAAGNWWGDLDPTNDINNSGGASLVYGPWYGDVPGTSPMTWYTDGSIQDAQSAVPEGDLVGGSVVPAGGTVAVDGASVVLGDIGLSANSATIIEFLDPEVDALPPVPADRTALGTFINVVIRDEDGNVLHDFAPPLEVCLPYTASDVIAAGGDPMDLMIGTAPSGESATYTWLEISRIDEGLQQVCASVSHLSIFGLFVEKQTVLPETGFAPGQATNLPATLTRDYEVYSDLTLNIPQLGLVMPIVGVPPAGESWDVSWLTNQAGWLMGTAFPTHSGNTVITSHVYGRDGLPGSFVDLKDLAYGDRISIEAWGQVYTYEVRENARVYWNNSSVLGHEDYDWLTLITCESFNPYSGSYLERRVVRAVLVEVSAR